VGLAKDDEVVEALMLDGLHPALGDRIQVGRLRPNFVDAHPILPQHRVEVIAELGVMIPQ